MRSNDEVETNEVVETTIYGCLDKCKQLIEDGYDVNKRDRSNVTLLHWSTCNQDTEVAHYYITKGADVNAVDGNSETPLYWAIKSGYFEMVELLTQNGADPRVRTKDGLEGIHLAVRFHQEKIVIYLLRYSNINADVNAVDENSETPLHWAIKNGYSEMVELLMQNGADPRIRTKEGLESIHLAIWFHQEKIVAYLLRHGNVPPDATDQNGKTPLMWAASRNYGNDLCQLLLSSGASASTQDLRGDTAMHLAVVAKNNAATSSLLHRWIEDHPEDMEIKNNQGIKPFEWISNKRPEWLSKDAYKKLKKLENRQTKMLTKTDTTAQQPRMYMSYIVR